MGWYFNTTQTVEQLVAELVTEPVLSPYKFVAGVLYGVTEVKVEGKVRKIITVTLIESSSPKGSGYKPMDETMGPSIAACPLHILEAADPPLNGYAKAWRQRCRDYIQYQEKQA